MTFLFSAIILLFWFFLFNFCFVDFGFCCGDFVWHFCFQLLFSDFGFSCSAFVSSILVFAVGILFHQCMLCLARNVVCFRCFSFSLWRFVSGIVVPICIWYLTEGWCWWVECFLIYLCMFSCFLFVIQVVVKAVFCPFEVDV